jgi:large conductance mechanosensitive channel
MVKGFKDFLLRGNVVDLAVAVVIGAAFIAVVTSFTDSFITPLIALLGGGGENGGRFTINGQDFTYGAFISALLGFLITAAIVYFLVIVPMKALLERQRRGEEPPPEAPAEDTLLLREIRDALAHGQARRDI